MPENKKNSPSTEPVRSNAAAAVCAFAVLAAFAAVLIIPQSREVFKSLSSAHPYIMGFIKFGLLATVGEVLALRLRKKAWVLPVYTVWRVIIWGLIGVAITFMMKTYSFGVAGLVESGYLPGAKAEFWNKLLCAFYTAAVMNLTFGPTFMAFHKCTDRYLELRAEGTKSRTPPSHRNGGLAQIRFLHAVQNDSAVLDSRTHSDLHAPSGVSGHCRRNSFHRSRNHFEP